MDLSFLSPSPEPDDIAPLVELHQLPVVPVVISTPAPVPVPVSDWTPDAITATEMRVAVAWRDGNAEGFERALAQLPPDLAAQHRRIAAAADRVRNRPVFTHQEPHRERV